MDTDTVLSRRALLKSAPVAVAATALPTMAVVAYSVPVEPETPAEFVNHPWVKARSFAKVLSLELVKIREWEGSDGWRAHVGPNDESVPVHYEPIGWRTPFEEQEYHLARCADANKALEPTMGGWTITRDVETGAVRQLVRHRHNAVADAIAAHSAARQHCNRCADQLERASLKFDEMAGPHFRVQVCVGHLLGLANPDRPIWATSHDTIDGHYDQQVAARCGIPGRETN